MRRLIRRTVQSTNMPGRWTVAHRFRGVPLRAWWTNRGPLVDRYMQEGRIVEDGTHAELSRAGGTYESLWDRQTGAFLEAE